MTAGDRTPKHFKFVDFLTGGMSTTRAISSPRRRRTSRKCLFGAPDRDETRRLMAEQFARDRRRILLRFNFDIETEKSPERIIHDDKENTPIKKPRSHPGSPSCRLPRTPSGGKSPAARRCLPRTPSKRSPLAPRQLHLTEYWSLRKRTESSSSDKE